MTPLADHSVDCFSIFATAEPSTLPRIFEVFSLFGVVPQRCHASTEAGDGLVVDVQLADLAPDTAMRLGKKLERLITVTQVLCSKKRRIAA